jgi:tRNA dimethylallyltransferase
MNIGTAKPDKQEQGGILHHFIDHISIEEAYSAGQFESEVNTLLENLFKENEIVFLVGGSGLFIDAVCKGFDESLPSDSKLRECLIQNYKNEGLEYLRSELQKVDPEFLNEVDQNNPQRLMRALEVCLITGKPYSQLREGKLKKRNYQILKILLNLDRNVIYDRINERVDLMVKKGLIEEAQNLQAYKHLNALNTVGYKECFDLFENKCTKEDAIEKIKQNTRRFAKRQLTWFRRDEEYTEFKPDEKDKIITFIDFVRQNFE